MFKPYKTENNKSTWQCQQCAKESFGWFMLNDSLWESITTNERFLCLSCCEKRLNKSIGLDDLKEHPTNDPLIHLLKR